MQCCWPGNRVRKVATRSPMYSRGKVNPSGELATTFPNDLQRCAVSKNFSRKRTSRERLLTISNPLGGKRAEADYEEGSMLDIATTTRLVLSRHTTLAMVSPIQRSAYSDLRD